MENYIFEKVPIIDGEITKVEIFTSNYIVNINVYIKTVNKATRFIKLSFEEVQEYGFYWNSNYSFYNIVDFKFLKTNGTYYISFDPDDETKEISENDQDIIKCNNIEIYFSNDNIRYDQIKSL